MAQTDICTIVWPLLSSTDSPTASNVSDVWIVGWNPRGLSVVVAWFLPLEPFHVAVTQLGKVKAQLKNHKPLPGLPSFQALQILGFVRGSSSAVDGATATRLPSTDRVTDYFGSPVSQLPAVLREGAVRQMRQSSDIWLDLVEGPMLGEVWCCGYRVQRCQLHIIRCEPNKWLTCKPTVFSATALYGPAGVRQLRSGKRPITVPGALSTAEGILLPDVLRRECAPRTSGTVPRLGVASPLALSKPRKGSSAGSLVHTPATSPFTARRTSAHSRSGRREPPAASDFSSDFSSDGSDADVTPPPALAAAGQFALATNQSQSFPYMSVFDAATKVAPRSGVPPRLDFPTSDDDGELSYMLRMSRACLRVRGVIETLIAPPNPSDNRDAPPSPRTPHQRREEEHEQEGEEMEEDGLSRATSPPCSPGADSADSAARTRQGTEAKRSVVDAALDGLLYVMLAVLPIVAQLSRFLWTMEVLEVRLRELINFFSLLRGRTNSCGLHPSIPHKTSSRRRRLFCYLTFLSGMLIDVLLGHFLRLQLLIGGPPLHQRAQHLTRRYLYENHMSYLDWFDGWPAGLKVNEDMNKTLCFFAKMVIGYWDALMRWPLNLARWVSAASLSAAPAGVAAVPLFGSAWQLPAFPTLGDPSGPTEYLWIVPSYGLILCLSFFGASFACALVADLTGIVTLHLRVLYHLAGFLYRGSTLLLNHFTLQFRGLKHNPLRKRTDTFEFTTDQMLTATLLSTTIVFLFPTIGVYYVYFAFIRASVRLVQETLAVVAYFLLHVPLFPTVYWIRYRGTMKKGLFLSSPKVTMRRLPQAGSGVRADVSSDMAHTVDMTVMAAPLPLRFMLTDFFVTLDILMKPFLPKHAIALFLSGTSDYGVGPIGELIPHLIANCVDPPCTLC